MAALLVDLLNALLVLIGPPQHHAIEFVSFCASVRPPRAALASTMALEPLPKATPHGSKCPRCNLPGGEGKDDEHDALNEQQVKVS